MTIDGMDAVQARIAEIQGRFASSSQADAAGFSQVLGAVSPSGNPPDRASFAMTLRAPGLLPLPGGGVAPADPWAGPLTPLQPLPSGVSPLGPAGPQSGPAVQAGPAPRDPLAPIIERVAAKHGVPAHLVRAIIHVESGGDPRAVSNRGAQGLMQLMPETARALGVTDPFDPEQNIDAGTRYLRHLLDQFGDPTRAIAAYNAGPRSVERYGGVPPFAETQSYVRRVERYDSSPPAGPR